MGHRDQVCAVLMSQVFPISGTSDFCLATKYTVSAVCISCPVCMMVSRAGSGTYFGCFHTLFTCISPNHFCQFLKTATNSNQVKRLCVAVDIQHLLLWFCRHWRQSHQLLLDADFFVHLKTRCLPSVLRNRWSFWSSSTKFTSSHNENPCAQQIA